MPRVLPLLLALCACVSNVYAQASGTVTIEPAEEVMLEAMPANDLDQIWVAAGDAEPSRYVTLTVPVEGAFPTGQPVPLRCEIQSRHTYQSAAVHLFITDTETGDIVAQERQDMDLFQGTNYCTFMLNADSFPPGKYGLLVEADYANDLPFAVYATTFKRVTDEVIAQRYAEVKTLVEQLNTAILSDEGNRAVSPYFGMRLNVVKTFLEKGMTQLDGSDWRATEATLVYLENAAQSLHAQWILQDHVPELTHEYVRPDMSTVILRDGGFYAGDQPVFLFGRAFENATPLDVAQMELYGLNLAEFTVAPEHSYKSDSEVKPFEGVFGPLFDRAQKRNVAVNVRLAPGRLGDWAFARWPEVRDKGFVDLAHKGSRSVFRQHVETVVPWLANQPMLMSMSIAEKPQFAFTDSQTLGAFIEKVKEMYPDRQELNKAWRAHLASYEDITLFPEFAHSYQNRRAFQYDWQSFYRALAVDHLQWAAGLVRQSAPGVPLMATLSDGAFEKGETRDGIDREAVAQMMDINGCSATTDPKDSIYALSYPRQSAFNTLMRSLQPNKPVFLVEDHIQLSPDTDPDYAYDYVRSALWEAVMTGANAAALPDNSVVLDRPETLEAFARTSLDINRLAEIVMAFQTARTEVAILFSSASKILDDGVPHLQSAWYAYEGCSFSGFNVRYVTEGQIRNGALEEIDVLVVPETPAVADETFRRLMKYVEEDEGAVARVGTPIPYNEHGQSRTNVLRMTGNTVLVRGMNLPTEYLHAMDAAIELGTLPRIPRPVNAHGFPLEGIRTRYVELDGTPYLYLVNLTPKPVDCFLAGGLQHGRDLIDGQEVSFPRMVAPLKPMLIKLDKMVYQKTVTATAPK